MLRATVWFEHTWEATVCAMTCVHAHAHGRSLVYQQVSCLVMCICMCLFLLCVCVCACGLSARFLGASCTGHWSPSKRLHSPPHVPQGHVCQVQHHSTSHLEGAAQLWQGVERHGRYACCVLTIWELLRRASCRRLVSVFAQGARQHQALQETTVCFALIL